MQVYILLTLIVCPVLTLEISLEEQFKKLSRQKRYLTIPYGSAIGMIVAFAIPADLPKQDVLFSWNVEANYNLPDELYYFGKPPTVPDLNQDPDLEDPTRRSLRSLNRKHTYNLIQQRFKMFGLNGQACLLRTICEISQSSLDHNGLIGQLLQVLFLPSSSREAVPSQFRDAEMKGLGGDNCEHIYPQCPLSLLELIEH